MDILRAAVQEHTQPHRGQEAKHLQTTVHGLSHEQLHGHAGWECITTDVLLTNTTAQFQTLSCPSVDIAFLQLVFSRTIQRQTQLSALPACLL